MSEDQVVSLRKAATVMVVRDGNPKTEDEGLYVLMVQRNASADFAGGAYVFPGGVVDPADSADDVGELCAGIDLKIADALLGTSDARSFWVAVIRECFEETGILLAREMNSSEFVSKQDPKIASRYSWARNELNAKGIGFIDFLRYFKIELACTEVSYFAHWITPVGAPKRFDTRFFVARAPDPKDQTPLHDDGETKRAVWLRPSDALSLHRENSIDLMFPTIRNLQAIDRFDTSEALLSHAQAAASLVPTVSPRIIKDGNGFRLALPGDEGYDDVELDVVHEMTTQATPKKIDSAIKKIARDANQ